MASILVTCPQQSASAESYYTTVCPQVRTQTCLWLSLLPLNAQEFGHFSSCTCNCRYLSCCTSEIS